MLQLALWLFLVLY